MIIEVRAKNSFVFKDEITFSMKANMHNKKFASNVYRENNFNILKVAGIYGANNVGKTCLIKCIRSIRNILLNKKNKLSDNIFSESPVCELGITFLEQGKMYAYDFKYDSDSEEYIYERFVEITRDKHGNEKENIKFIKDTIQGIYELEDKELEAMLPIVAKNNILIYLLDTSKFKMLNSIKEILISFASKIDIVDMNNIPIEKTINLLKNKNQLQDKVVNLIKDADLDLENFEYADINNIVFEEVKNGEEKAEEKVLDIPKQVMDQIRLVSVYKGVRVPSILFDSTGTKKIAALASYIIEALESGRILVIDELDSSLHFKLTRAIVAMFNNELNTNAQMIFTVHDINLMDCKRLFRKEQIWFVHKDEEGVYVYSLADFTAAQGVRDTSDIIEKYRKGVLGALPEPELINTLINVKGTK